MTFFEKWAGFRDWRWHAWIALAARWYLAYVFLLACYHKILEPLSFAVDVATYQFLPLWSINIFAITLPWVELITGILLVIGWKARPAALLVSLMMIAFIIALIHALSLGLDMSCGCFASNAVAEDDPISAMTVLRDSAWLALALYVMVFDRRAIGVQLFMETLSHKAGVTA